MFGKRNLKSSPAKALSLLVVTLIAASGFVVAPQSVSALSAGADSERKVTITTTCDSTSLTLGSIGSCTSTVKDTESGGTKTVPRGTVALTVTSGRIAIISSCTLAYVATANQSECTYSFVLLNIGNGAPDLKFAYTPASDDIHESKSKNTRLATSGSSFKQISTKLTSSSAGGATQGNSFSLFTVGCASSSTRYIGAFVSAIGDPATSGVESSKVFERSPLSDGSDEFSTALENAHPTGEFFVRFYCDNESPSSYSSATFLASSAKYTFTVSAAAAFLQAAQAGTAATQAGVGNYTADPEDVSGVDTEQIPGAQMIMLKQRVDATLPLTSRVDRLSQAFRGKIPPRNFVDLWVRNLAAGRTDAQLTSALSQTPEYFWTYALLTPAEFVNRAYLQLLGRAPTAVERSQMVNALNSNKQTRPAALAALASSQEHILRTANRSYVMAAYQALTPLVPTQDQLKMYSNALNNFAVKVPVLEDLALSRTTYQNWIAALAANPSSARF